MQVPITFDSGQCQFQGIMFHSCARDNSNLMAYYINK